jgi:lysophospholipase L1-like esterase
VSGWTDIKVAIPSYGANANGALYQVSPGGGAAGKNVLVDQGATSGTNTWVDLGDFDLGSGASVSLSNVTPNTVTIGVGVSGSDLAWSAAAFIPVSGPSWSYTAMGDSYSSGEGNPPYDVGTAGGCDRSNAAFGRQFAERQSDIGTTGIQHIACSGATIDNLTTDGQNGERPQISQMFSGSKLVTVTIGGNDAGFASVLTNCLTTPTTCENTYNSDDGNNEYSLIDSLRPKLAAAYTAMQHQVPGAKIVAVTYPSIFQPGTTCAGINNMPVSDVEFLISLTYYLDNTIMDAAQDAGINVMDERYAFLGHELCSSDPWVYSLPIPFPSGTKVLDTSAWFHPTTDGLGQIATDLAAYWQALKSGQPESAASGVPETAKTAAQVTNAAPGNWVPVNLWHGLPDTAEAKQMLAELPRTSTRIGGYDPNASYWAFITRGGCDTRNRVLRAQAVSPKQWTGTLSLLPSDGSCPVTQGSWQTPYDIPETPLNLPTQVDIANAMAIDHIVPKADAWATGAGNWIKNYGNASGTALLRDFSNDQDASELLAVSSASNSSKADSSPDEWMPTNTGMTCPYIEAWIEVKHKWALAVSTVTGFNGTSELTFLQNTLNGC